MLDLENAKSKVDYLVQRRDLWAWEYALANNLVQEKYMSIKFFYPGWTRKAITFTIDDGNVEKVIKPLVNILKGFDTSKF